MCRRVVRLALLSLFALMISMPSPAGATLVRYELLLSGEWHLETELFFASTGLRSPGGVVVIPGPYRGHVTFDDSLLATDGVHMDPFFAVVDMGLLGRFFGCCSISFSESERPFLTVENGELVGIGVDLITDSGLPFPDIHLLGDSFIAHPWSAIISCCEPRVSVSDPFEVKGGSITIFQVPQPAPLILTVLGLVALAAVARRRR